MVMRKDDIINGSGRVIKDQRKTSSDTFDRILDKQVRPIRAWRIAFLVLCTVGGLLSADLLRLHVKVYKDPNYHAFCAMSEQLNCETVATSSWAVLAGLPVALWGLVGYFFLGGLCICGLYKRRQPASWPFGILFWLSLFSVFVSIAMYVISHAFIGAFCIICVATYVTNFLLCGLAIADLRFVKSGPLAAVRAEVRGLLGRKFTSLIYVLSFAAVLIVLWSVVPAYWQAGVSTGPGGLLAGTTTEGFHWIGARAPLLHVIEFSDYQCPYCSRGHSEIRKLTGKHPDKIRLVHRHFPLRRHRFAFAYAKMAYCSGQQKRFWQANDYLFKTGRRRDAVTPAELATAIQINPQLLSTCVDSEAAKVAVSNDIAAGRGFKIRGTPTYVIGNKTYPGRIPKKVISAALTQKQNE